MAYPKISRPDPLLSPPQLVNTQNFITTRPKRDGAGNGGPVAPVANPNLPAHGGGGGAKGGANNSGFGRFLELHRGSRGGMRSNPRGKPGLRYTSGPFKGMTEGEADVVAHQKYQKMGDKAKDQFRPMGEADFQRERERAIQAQKDQFEIAREQQRTIRREIAEEAEARNQPPARNPNAGKFDPNAPAGGADMVKDKKPVDKPRPPVGRIGDGQGNYEDAAEVNSQLRERNKAIEQGKPIPQMGGVANSLTRPADSKIPVASPQKGLTPATGLGKKSDKPVQAAQTSADRKKRRQGA